MNAPPSRLADTARLRDFVLALGDLIAGTPDEQEVLDRGAGLLKRLIAQDDWLPDDYARPDPERYRQYLLHCDSRERFSIVSFVWGPGQATPIHDHRIWGLVGVLRGDERVEQFRREEGGRLSIYGEPALLKTGEVDAFGPRLGDIHRVSNADPDRVSISIHVYGANIGAVERATYDEAGTPKAVRVWLREHRAAKPLGSIGSFMTSITPQAVRHALLTRAEIAIFDLRDEHAFAQAHPLFAAQIPPDRIALEAGYRLPRHDVPIILYDGGEGLVAPAIAAFQALGYGDVRALEGGLGGWRDAGYELFQDVNSYSKAFGELVEHRRHTPSLSADDVHALIEERADIAILDARRFDEYATMSIPTGTSVPGAELVLRTGAVAPDPDTLIIVNCAGRTRSIIGAQSLLNAGIPNRVAALRNGTIGWTLAGKALDRGQQRQAPEVGGELIDEARARARDVAYRAGVKRIDAATLAAFVADDTRTLYRFDVRTPAEYAAGHPTGFFSAPGGQLVQETDHSAPVRGARIVLADDLGPRADMSASWLAQMGWEVYVLDGFDGPLETGAPAGPPPRTREGRYKRPYEGTDNQAAAMQAYLDWEYGLVAQLARDGTHGFYVI